MDWQRLSVILPSILFCVVGAIELRWPRIPLTLPSTPRWLLHFALFLLNSWLPVFVLRTSGYSLAVAGQGTLGFIPFLLIADFALWCSHYILHHTRPGWAFHAVHHSDPDYDVSTAFRFHPAEAIWESAITLGLVWLLAPTPTAYLLYILASLAANFFVHANLTIPDSIQRPLSWVLVTPSLHRAHHSTELHHQLSNYGVIFSIWDRLFSTLKTPTGIPSFGLPSVTPPQSISPAHLLLHLPAHELRTPTQVPGTNP